MTALCRSASAETASADQVWEELPVWDLGDLYAAPDAPEVKADLDWARKAASAFAARYRGRLTELAESANAGSALGAALTEFEAIEERLGRLASYAGLLYAQNNLDPAVAKFYGDMQGALNDIASELLFFTLELNEIDEARLEAAIAADSTLARYAPWLRDVRALKPYQLSDEVERLFHDKSLTAAQSWSRLFDETMARLGFEIDGQSLRIEQALDRLSSHEAGEREKAAGALSKTFTANLPTFTLITNTLAKDKQIEDKWRGFEDVADSRHVQNRVEREVVDALEAAVAENQPRLSHRYYAWKAQEMGVEALDFWDRNAPLPGASDEAIGWDKAKATVLDAYRGFAPRMADIASEFFERGWIDAAIREGKSPGAFSHSTVPSVHPYVLLNYQGKARDVMTLAHELGHGVHQVLAADQGLLLAETPLTLAETASVFGEMLTFRALLAAETDPAARKHLLASKVEDMLNTVVRQMAFYRFERKVHEARREGELTAEDLNRFWLEVQGDSLGPAIRLNSGYETYWTYIPHFIHSPFYVYAYAFGDCLVNALYGLYADTPDGFAERYFEMLKAGGSKRHQELLAPFGLDASDPAFWQRGLDVISSLIDELEATA